MGLPSVMVDVPGGENWREPYITEINRTGQVIREIPPICEYLEELNPTPALICSNPEERAETRMWTR